MAFSFTQIVYQFLDSFAFLIIASLGLAVIFGIMGIINQAHGEFVMLGCYAFSIATGLGVPHLFAIVFAMIFTAIFGGIVDRLIIRRLYHRPLDSIVATWGLSLVLSQGIRVIFGPFLSTVAVPFGSVMIGDERYSVYRLVLILVAALMLVGFYLLFTRTRFGLYSRATTQNTDIAKCLGVNTNRTYMVIFMVGSALTGLAGALYAPLLALTPNLGNTFTSQSFATVIVGGANPLIGTFLAGGTLGLVDGALSLLVGSFFGRLGLLIVSILFIRLFPTGFTGLVEKIQMRRMGASARGRD